MRKRGMQINIVPKSVNKDLEFWLNKKTSERIEAVEFLRMQNYVLSGHQSIPRFVHSIQIRKIDK